MENIEKLLLQILESQNKTNERIEKLEQKVGCVEAKLNHVETKLDQIETKLDAVYDQTADLTEFKTFTKSKLDKLSDDLDFLTHKETQTEKDVFTIKKKLKTL